MNRLVLVFALLWSSPLGCAETPAPPIQATTTTTFSDSEGRPLHVSANGVVVREDGSVYLHDGQVFAVSGGQVVARPILGDVMDATTSLIIQQAIRVYGAKCPAGQTCHLTITVKQ